MNLELPIIEERVQGLVQSMGITPVTVRCHFVSPHLYIQIEAGAIGKVLIGPGAAHLAALQQIIRSMLRRTIDPTIRTVVDVNGYRARREQDLVVVAETAATRAIQQGQSVILPPMNSADRRAIHTALAGRADVTTTSTGEEPRRGVVIKPVFL